MPEQTRPPGRGVEVRALVRTVLRDPLTRRAWAEAAYCLLTAPVGIAGALVLLVLLALGAGFLVSLLGAVLGLLLMVTGMGLGRGLGSVHRILAGRLLGERFPGPVPFRSPEGLGLVGRLDARLRDRTGWRHVGYTLVKLPVSLVCLYAALWWASGLANLTAPLRWALFGAFPPADGGRGMVALTPLPFGGSPTVTTFPGTLLAAAIGLATVLTAPWLARAVVGADRRLIRALLGPVSLSERVRDLEETRALAVDDSVALLRRVERDLHDGAQVRLVALALSLDMIKNKLSDDKQPIDIATVRRLVESAHTNATEALTELRDLSRGIHPPVLDDGLPDALATLTARSTVPVQLHIEVDERPSPAIETIAYFCAAELLTNLIKHSGARQAEISVLRRDDGTLGLRVSDDGCGGARGRAAA